MNAPFEIISTEIGCGISVIEASAGTGKTYAISRLVPRLLLEGTVSRLSEILLVTFTKDAARELSDRVRSVFESLHAAPAAGEESADPALHEIRNSFSSPEQHQAISRALLEIDRLGVFTFHAFCQRVIQAEGVLCGLPVMPDLSADNAEFVENAVYSFWKNHLAADGTLSALASYQGWDPGADLESVRTVLGLESFEADPPARPLEGVLRELRDGASGFSREVIGELEDLVGKVKNWNQSAGDDQFRRQQIEGLADASDFSVWASRVEWLQNLGKPSGGLIASRGKEARELIASAGHLAGVQLAVRLHESLSQIRWHWQLACAEEARKTVAVSLQRNRQITYDGLVSTIRDSLRDSTRGPVLAGRLKEQYKVALIDESQDTDPQQFEIFRRIFDATGHRLVLIGDPKQAIYGFRGADVNTYLAARSQAGANVFSLSQTFRSPQPLVTAINAIFGRPGSLLKDGLGFSPSQSGLKGDLFLEGEEARLVAWVVPDGDAESYSNSDKRSPLVVATVASEIVRLLRSGARIVQTSADGSQGKSTPVAPGDFAVLVSSNDQATDVIAALRERGVPAIQAQAADVMSSDEAGELLVLLNAILEPGRGDLRRAALATRLLGRTAAQIRPSGGEGEGDEALLARFFEWHSTWQGNGVAAALAQVDRDEGVSLRLASTAQGERRLTNLRQLGDLLQAASLETAKTPAHLVRWLSRQIAGAAGRSDDEQRQQHLESDADTVQVVTMHSAKGLEYNLVFCPFLWSSWLPRREDKTLSLNRPGAAPLLFNPKLSGEWETCKEALLRNALEDRLRLAYVALTRARVRAWVYCGAVAGRKTPFSALDWLLREEDAPEYAVWSGSYPKDKRGEAHAAGLRRIAECAGEPCFISAVKPPAPSGDTWAGSGGSLVPSLVALAPPHIPKPWGLTSFSALTREKSPHGADEPTQMSEASGACANTFSSAPGGATVGTAVHEWIQRWDFSEVDKKALATHLAAFPLGANEMAEAVEGMLDDLRGAFLPGIGCTVAEACPNPESSEWHFQLPIGASLHSRSLAEAFSRSGEEDYARVLRLLPEAELAGFLHGFLDRIAFFDGTWGVIDWKTNKLGQGYGPASLLACARESHYLLQTHLYLVALRRWLGPNAPIAGAWLVFLRGIRAGTQEGILAVSPSSALLDRLDALFAVPHPPPS